MRYLLYFFTILLLFGGGLLVGNTFLPTRDESLAVAVSVPELSTDNPVLQTLSREQAQQDLEQLNAALSACPVVVGEEKDRLLHRILLRLALEDFELKKIKLELEIAKNNEQNRSTSQLAQATSAYTQALARVQKMADTYFPVSPTTPTEAVTPIAPTTAASSAAPTAPATPTVPAETQIPAPVQPKTVSTQTAAAK